MLPSVGLRRGQVLQDRPLLNKVFLSKNISDLAHETFNNKWGAKLKKTLRQAGFLCIAVMLVVFTAGCASHVTTIVPRPPAHAQKKLGRVEGRASGSLFQAIFPILLNSRTERAYADALAKAPGATALVDVTIQEDWYWYFFGTISTVTISGEAVK